MVSAKAVTSGLVVKRDCCVMVIDKETAGRFINEYKKFLLAIYQPAPGSQEPVIEKLVAARKRFVSNRGLLDDRLSSVLQIAQIFDCAKKLLHELKALGSKMPAGIAPGFFGPWHANLIRIERRKCILAGLSCIIRGKGLNLKVTA